MKTKKKKRNQIFSKFMHIDGRWPVGDKTITLYPTTTMTSCRYENAGTVTCKYRGTVPKKKKKKLAKTITRPVHAREK